MATFLRGQYEHSEDRKHGTFLAGWLKKASTVRSQERVLAGEVTRTGRGLPMTKPGDPVALRGVPVLGAMSGTILGTQPEQATVRKLTWLEDIHERAA